jgi:transposase
MSKVSQLEVIRTGVRRRWSAEEKRRIVAESESGPRQVSATARRHGLLPSQLFNWRRLAREGQLEWTADAVPFARAVIACDAAGSGLPSCAAVSAGRIEIVLADGVRILVDRDVDADALARVIGAILRR